MSLNKTPGAAPTPRQGQVMEFIGEYRHRTGCSPTMQEIADALRIDRTTVYESVVALEAKGHLRRTIHAKRSLELTAPPPQPRLRFPIVGWIGDGRIGDLSEAT